MLEYPRSDGHEASARGWRIAAAKYEGWAEAGYVACPLVGRLSPGMLDEVVLPPGLTLLSSGAELLPWIRFVGRAGERLGTSLVE